MGMSIYVSLMNIKLCFPIQTFRTFTINLVRKQRQVTRESCSLWQLRWVLLKIYDLIFKFRNKSSILDLLFLTVYRGYKVRDRLTERLLSSFTVF